jgi:hypothetical protein
VIDHVINLGLCAVLSLVTILAAAITRPTRAQCPQGWYLATGVRTSDTYAPRGSFACQRPPGGPDWTGTGPDLGTRPPGELRGRIYCTGGSSPIVVNERTVGCQR